MSKLFEGILREDDYFSDRKRKVRRPDQETCIKLERWANEKYPLEDDVWFCVFIEYFPHQDILGGDDCYFGFLKKDGNPRGSLRVAFNEEGNYNRSDNLSSHAHNVIDQVNFDE